jgi:hypothetical protein
MQLEFWTRLCGKEINGALHRKGIDTRGTGTQRVAIRLHEKHGPLQYFFQSHDTFAISWKWKYLYHYAAIAWFFLSKENACQ